MIPVELSRIVIRDNEDQQYIYVNEINGNRGFPIVIGSFEAAEINRKVAQVPTPRPMTHDLIHLILDAFGAKVEKIVINDLAEGTYYAHLYLLKDGEQYQIDCRPSDAIALATALSAPIFVEECVMNEAGKSDDDDDVL